MRRVHADGVVLIRPLEQADRDALFASVRESIAEVSAWLPWCHSAYMPEEATAFIESTRQSWANEAQFNFGVFDAQTGDQGSWIGAQIESRLNSRTAARSLGTGRRTQIFDGFRRVGQRAFNRGTIV